MATITPTLTITANASSHSSVPGPISTSLSISATTNLTVDAVEAKTLVFTGAGDEQTLFDGSAQDASQVAGTNGGFIYLKNATASDLDIYIGIVADDGSATDLAAS